MRIHLVNLNLVGPDAIGQAVIRQARHFRRRGDDVSIFTTAPPDAAPEDVAALVRVVRAEDLADSPGDAFWRGDLYVYHYPGHYSLVETIKRLERGAVIFYYHNVTPPELWGDDEIGKSLRRSIEAVRDLIRYADLIVTPSPFNARELAERHGADPARVIVLHNPVPLDTFAPGPKDPDLLARYGLSGRRVIAFAGRMAGNKRIDLLIEALPRVLKAVPAAALLLVGDDHGAEAFRDNVARARARATALGVADRVVFTGIVDDLPAHLRLADVYASASLHEGFGVPLIEAMASGIPVVASNATAHPDVVGDAGLLAEAGSAEHLADQIVRALADDGLHGALVNRGLQRAQQFSADRYEAEWARIVTRAVAWLPRQPYPDLMAAPTHTIGTIFEPPAPALSPAARPLPQDLEGLRAILLGHIVHLDVTADVMKRGYVVRSKMPIFGPLIAWIRRNLTSHLREPYLDPIVEKQVAFNRHVAFTLHQILDAMIDDRMRKPADGDSTDAQGAEPV